MGLQSLLLKAMSEGRYRIDDRRVAPALSFFTTVRRLMLLLHRCNRADGFRRAAREYFGVEPLTADHLAKGKTLEKLSTRSTG